MHLIVISDTDSYLIKILGVLHDISSKIVKNTIYLSKVLNDRLAILLILKVRIFNLRLKNYLN